MERGLHINKIYTIIFISLIAILIFLDSIDLFSNSGLDNEFSLNNINVMNWTVFISSVIAVLGTWYVTNKANDKVIEFEKTKYNDEKAFQKEMAYRQINKQNVKTIYENIKIFRKRNVYVYNLLKINMLFDFNIFKYELQDALKFDLEFLKNLKEDFFL